MSVGSVRAAPDLLSELRLVVKRAPGSAEPTKDEETHHAQTQPPNTCDGDTSGRDR